MWCGWKNLECGLVYWLMGVSHFITLWGLGTVAQTQHALTLPHTHHLTSIAWWCCGARLRVSDDDTFRSHSSVQIYFLKPLCKTSSTYTVADKDCDTSSHVPCGRHACRILQTKYQNKGEGCFLYRKRAVSKCYRGKEKLKDACLV